MEGWSGGLFSASGALSPKFSTLDKSPDLCYLTLQTLLKAPIMDLLEELFNLVEVHRDNYSGLYALHMPSGRAVQALYSRLGVRAPVPENSDPIWDSLNSLVRARMPFLQKWANMNSTYGRQIKNSPRPEDPLPTAGSTQEARIKEMNGEQAFSACRAQGLQFTPHPTNPGISAMRAKNALYSALRRANKRRQEDPVPQVSPVPFSAPGTTSRNPWGKVRA